MPRIEESLDVLTGAHWFATMDLASSYNQVPVAEADRPKTAFFLLHLAYLSGTECRLVSATLPALSSV